MPQESSPAIAALVKALEALPGYGPRSAQRAAFFLLSPKRRGELQALRQALADAVRAAAPGAKGRSAKSAQIRQETHRCSA